MSQQLGKWLIVIGLIVLVTGCIIYFAGNKLKWVGNLPGDIRIEKENFQMYIPITTMLIFSLILSLLIRLVNYLK